MGVLGAVGGMEAVRALPPAAQIQAVKGIAEAGNAVDRAGNAVRNWARNNPNTSEVAKAAANVGGTAFAVAKGISHVRSHYEFGGIGGNAVTRRQMGAVSVPKRKTEITQHALQRKQEAQYDSQRSVGDSNRIVREGKQYIDQNTGNHVYVKGDRVVILSPEGRQITQFKNSKSNTHQRIRRGQWTPK